jgi:hypothetical protein
MDIFVKYSDSDTLHHFRTGDGEGSDPASFRASVFNGRRDVQLLDADGVELDEIAPIEEVAPAEVVVVTPTLVDEIAPIEEEAAVVEEATTAVDEIVIVE